MRFAGVIAAFVIVGSCSGIKPVRPIDPDAVWLRNGFVNPRVAGTKALRTGEYRKAIELFTAGAEAARLAKDFVSQGRFLANLSSAHIMLGENRLAIHHLVIGREAAFKSGDLLTLQSIEASLANVYVFTGDYEAAGAAAGRGAKLQPATLDRARQALTLMSFGRAMAKASGVDAAVPIWKAALAQAEAANSTSLEADILDHWGFELSEQNMGNAPEAEDVFARSWYKRKLANDSRLPLTEGKLARFYRQHRDIASARKWIDRTLRAYDEGRNVPVPEWVMRSEEAQITSDEGRLRASLQRFRRAQRLMEEWREKLPPMERSRLAAERRMIQELVEGYLWTAGRLYRQKPSPALAAEMFALIQNTRAWSLDATGKRSGGQSAGLYAEARRLEGRWLAGDESAKTALGTLRTAILEREAATATHENLPPGGGKLEAPAAGEAVLTYWLHSDGSWLWVWTRQGLRVTTLPARETILASAEDFRNAIERNEPAEEQGRRLRTLLLGSLEKECLQSTRWDIVADEGLFQIPFGALPGRNARYLAEEVELRLVPNAQRQSSGMRPNRRFFAIADPIFNTADERRATAWPWQSVVHAGNGLPRLPGTRREAKAAKAMWTKAGYETSVYTGIDSDEESVLARLTDWQPGVVHFATHTLAAQGRPRLALTLRADGSQGLLTAEDIATLPLRAELVVMSACHSIGSEAAKGSGLLGLTRAWLTAGARQVVSTLWPVGDESTSFFSVFYERLASEKNASLPVAAALRQAQLACIRAGGVAAQPRNWAGHVLLARR